MDTGPTNLCLLRALLQVAALHNTVELETAVLINGRRIGVQGQAASKSRIGIGGERYRGWWDSDVQAWCRMRRGQLNLRLGHGRHDEDINSYRVVVGVSRMAVA